jgi:hypothetical protein
VETRLSMMVLKRVGFLVNTLNTQKGQKPLCFLPTDLRLRHQSLVVALVCAPVSCSGGEVAR